MDGTIGHQLVVNEYVEECLRKAQEQEAERDNASTRLHEGDTVAARPPDGPAPRP